MPIVRAQTSLIPEESAIPLARYARILGVDECAFWGVRRDDVTYPGCRDIWIKSERDMVARYLAEAQTEVEQVLGYPLSRRWFAGEAMAYSCPLLCRWGQVVAGGVRAVSNIAIGTAVNHATDPAVIGPLATTVTDEAEIHVYYPVTLVEEEVEIVPSDIDIAGGAVTIFVPRCRMVHPSVADNDRSGLDYTVLANFLATVDVKRVYNDPSTHASLVWPHGNCTSVCQSCGEYTMDGCIYVRSGELGVLDVLPATYSAGAWASASACCRGRPERVRLNYYAGKASLTRQEEDAVVRLAHSKMPDTPCGCDDIRRLWERDRKQPEVMTREQLNNPFGTNAGAWIAWRFANAMKLVRGGIL